MKNEDYEWMLNSDWPTFKKLYPTHFFKSNISYFLRSIEWFYRNKVVFKEYPELLKKFNLLRELSKKIYFDVMKIDLELEFTKMKSIQYSRKETGSTVHNFLYKNMFKNNSEIIDDAQSLITFYKNMYEDLGNTNIKLFVDNIKPKITSNGDRIRVLREYDSAKFSSLFDCLDNVIRNAFEHKDYEIDVDKKCINIFKNGKKLRSISLDEFQKICMGIIHLEFLFDALYSEIGLNKFNEQHLNNKGWRNFY